MVEYVVRNLMCTVHVNALILKTLSLGEELAHDLIVVNHLVSDTVRRYGVRGVARRP